MTLPQKLKDNSITEALVEIRFGANELDEELSAPTPYVLRASEGASFVKTFHRSPRVVHDGELR